jgi:phosphate starvation-inducible protein PhoH
MEAQNMSPAQMKTLLTRIGEHSKFIISGDLDQSDKYRDYTKSGLYDAMTRHKNITDIGFVVFSDADIVRNPIIKKIIANYPRLDATPIVVKDKNNHTHYYRRKTFKTNFYLFLNKIISFLSYTHITIKLVI